MTTVSELTQVFLDNEFKVEVKGDEIRAFKYLLVGKRPTLAFLDFRIADDKISLFNSHGRQLATLRVDLFRDPYFVLAALWPITAQN